MKAIPILEIRKILQSCYNRQSISYPPSTFSACPVM